MKKTLIALFATASVLGGVSYAQADTHTNTLTVKATLSNGCNIDFNDGSVVAYPSLMSIDHDMPQTHYFKIKCTNSLLNPDGSKDTNSYSAQSVALNAGDVVGSTVAQRLMANKTNGSKSADTLNFQVYQGTSAATKKIWGDQAVTDNQAASYDVSKPSIESDGYPFTVVLPQQDISGKMVGEYTNTMVATVTYTGTPGK